MDFAFASARPRQPVDEPADAAMPQGFVGRDAAILAIERAMRRPPAGILVHGLAGVGRPRWRAGSWPGSGRRAGSPPSPCG